MRKAIVLIASALGFVAIASGASAGNVALSSDGAIFFSGSSFITDAPGYNQAIAEANLLTTTPSQAYSNSDTRYIFGGGQNSAQNLVIELGSTDELTSFAATFGATDRTPQGLSISVSSNGTVFAPVSGSLATQDGGSEYVFTPSSPVTAKYIEYSFGGPSSQYNFGGSGIGELFANAVPEPATWLMLIVGLGMTGVALRRRGSHATA